MASFYFGNQFLSNLKHILWKLVAFFIFYNEIHMREIVCSSIMFYVAPLKIVNEYEDLTLACCWLFFSSQTVHLAWTELSNKFNNYILAFTLDCNFEAEKCNWLASSNTTYIWTTNKTETRTGRLNYDHTIGTGTDWFYNYKHYTNIHVFVVWC